MGLIDDPDIQAYLNACGDDPYKVKDESFNVHPSFAQDPEALAFAGISPPPPAPLPSQPAPELEQWNDGQAGVSPPQPSPEIKKMVDEHKALQQQTVQTPPITPAGDPARGRLVSPVPRVPGPLNQQAERVAQSAVDADAEAIRAKEEELRIMREAHAKRRGEIEAQTAAKTEEQQRQDATNLALQGQLTELGQEKDAPLEPGRFISNVGFGGALLAAATAFAYGFMNPNDHSQPIAKVLNDGIEREIHAQEVAIRDAKDQRANRLGILRDKLGSNEAARARLRIELTDLADKHVDIETKDTKSMLDQAGLGATKSALAAEREKGVFELQKALYHLQPKLKGTGDLWVKRNKEMQAKIEYAQQLKSQHVPDAEIEKLTGIKPGAQTPDQLAAGERERAGDERTASRETLTRDKEAEKGAEKLGKDLDPAKGLHSALEGVYKAAGITRDENGNLVRPKDIPGRGTLDTPVTAVKGAFGMATPGTGVSKSVVNARDVLGRTRTGAVMNPSEKKEYGEMLDATTEANFFQNLQIFDDFLRQREREIREGYGDAVVEAYDRNRKREIGEQPREFGTAR